MSYDRQHASKVWQCAIRLKEQCTRFGLPCEIIELFPETAADLRAMENESQVAAKRLSNYTGIAANSIEQLLTQVGGFGCSRETQRWQY